MKNDLPPRAYLNQHLVNPENCLRCASCERVCTAGAISHDTNFVVDPEKCTGCLDCLAECPTGAIDNWRIVPREQRYSLEQQHVWDALPQPLGIPAALVDPSWTAARSPGERSSTAPASAPKPHLNLFDPRSPAQALVRSNVRVTSEESGSDVHHIILDCGNSSPLVLEGQTLGVVPPGTDESGKRHMLRLYSVASAREGETEGRGDIALTVKRVTHDRAGNPRYGIASNYLCDLEVGSTVQLTGPYGGSFLMPDDASAKLLMIATGTGIAPMRAMIQRRRRRGELEARSAVLFYGGRTPDAMPYYAELAALAPDHLSLYPAYSRQPSRPRRYVQNAVMEAREHVAALLRDPLCHVYLCGLRSMEQEVLAYLHRICMAAHIDWPALREQLHCSGRLHLETY